METPHSNTTPDTRTSSTENTATNTTTQESRIAIRNADGYTGLLEYSQYTSALPRGLIFIDPPYQYGSDTERIVHVIQRLKYHWRSARLVIWFPTSHAFQAKSERLLALVQEAIASAGPPNEKNYKNKKQKNNSTNKKTKHKIDGLCIELYPNYHTTDSSSKSNSTTTTQQQQQHTVIGTGMIFINPPYGLETDLQVLLPDLGTLLFDDNKDEGSSGGGDGGQHRRVENDHDDGNNADDEEGTFNQDDSADNDGAHTHTHKNEKYTLKIQRF